MLKYHIQTIEVPAAGASNITFSSIPQIYDDLLICYSARTNRSFYNSDIYLHFNNDTGANYSFRRLYGDGTGSSSDTLSNNSQGGFAGNGVGANATSNTFSNSQIYIPDYRSSVAKYWSVDSVGENNASASLQTIQASIWSGTSPITSISLKDYNAANFTQYSSASLYGIKRGADSVTRTSPVATGGTIVTSGGFTYHTFTSSGTFSVPTSALNVEALVVAGGGGGGGDDGAGGGAGGLISLSQRVVPGTYTVTVGAGGNGATSTSVPGSRGTDSAFGLFALAVGGGGGKSRGSGSLSVNDGGSGGGGSYNNPNPGASVSGQGFAGGLGSMNAASGGGGGAGEAGKNSPNAATAPSTGNGGNGLQFSVWATATGTGHQGYYAGGGGGGTAGAFVTGGGAGGLGGGAAGNFVFSNPKPSPAQANTGGGGGGQGNAFGPDGGNGGSGIVIIRYPTPA